MGVVTHFWNLHNGRVPEDAASLGCFDLKGLRFRTEAAEQLEMSPKIFPRPALDYPALGAGPGGAPVFVALGDNQASLLGAVRELSRSVHVNIGTGSQISMFAQRYVPAPGIDVRPFPFGGHVLVGAGLCGGRAYSLLHDFFERALRLFTPGAADAVWEAMNAVTPESLPNPRRLVVDTRFQGTRSDPSIRGSISNLAPETFTPEHLIVGLREGMAAELFGHYQSFGAAARNVDTLVGSGNGIRLNPELRRTFELKFAMPMRAPRHREEAACGAARLAGVAGGLLADLGAAGQLIRYDTEGGPPLR
jgi:sedoheptulokinase